MPLPSVPWTIDQVKPVACPLQRSGLRYCNLKPTNRRRRKASGTSTRVFGPGKAAINALG